MRTPIVAAVGYFAVLSWSLTGCGGNAPAPPTPTVHAGTTASTPSGEFTSSSTAAPQSWTMPDLRGKNLQEAQDAIQDLTNDPFRHSDSKDLTGQDRHQILDRDWQVCSSTPAPGKTFSTETTIEFGVVRVDSESCPA